MKLFKKKSIKLSKYFEIIKPKYVYLKLITHNSIRNYSSDIIAKTIQSMYKTTLQRIKLEEKKLFIETSIKCSYFIDIQKNDTAFYFIVPKQYKNIIKDKLVEVWKQISIEEVKEIQNFTEEALKYQLIYKKEDALSLKVDKKNNAPLSSILNVLDIMQEDDRIGIFYNFMPFSQTLWKKMYKETMDKFNKNLPIERNKIDKIYIAKMFGTYFLKTLQMLTDCTLDFLGEEKKKDNEQTILELATGLLNSKKTLSNNTLRKKEIDVLNTQIMLLSDSKDSNRKKDNIIATANSYNSIIEDNELVYKKISKKHIFNVSDFKIAGVEENKFSTDECQNFLQLPARELLEKFPNIKHGDLLENDLCKELQKGYIRLGTHCYKGNEKTAYMSEDKNLANLGLVALGGQGCGKTTYFKNYSKDVIAKGENLIIIDFIKNCEFSSDVETVIDKNKLTVIDLSDEKNMQGLGYNEINFTNNMTNFEILETSNLISQQDMALIDAINSDGTPLTSRMRRYLSASANIVHLQENKSFRDVVNVLQDFRIRQKTLDNIPQNFKEYLQDEINALEELNEVKEFKDKETKETHIEVVGTKESKIEHILDRINLLKEDFKLKFMFNKTLENNINFAEELEKGKVILIKIPEHKFQSKYVKNVIVTYFITKIWLACQLRGKLHDKPLRTHLILDEIFQAPTSEFILQDILLQARKFQLKCVFSVHYLSKFRYIKETLKASGSSFMLLAGTDKKNFEEFKEELEPFSLDDLLNLPQFHSLNLIKTKKGFAKFITKLP